MALLSNWRHLYTEDKLERGITLISNYLNAISAAIIPSFPFLLILWEYPTVCLDYIDFPLATPPKCTLTPSTLPGLFFYTFLIPTESNSYCPLGPATESGQNERGHTFQENWVSLSQQVSYIKQLPTSGKTATQVVSTPTPFFSRLDFVHLSLHRSRAHFMEIRTKVFRVLSHTRLHPSSHQSQNWDHSQSDQGAMTLLCQFTKGSCVTYKWLSTFHFIRVVNTY